MEGSDEGEVILKELKDTVLLLVKQMVELKSESEGRNCFKKLRRSIGESFRLRDQVWSWKRASRAFLGNQEDKLRVNGL